MTFARHLAVPPHDHFTPYATRRERLRAACAAHPDVAAFHALGESEAGRPVDGVVLGHGPRSVCLIAGNHADEPVGPETLLLLVEETLRRREVFADLLNAFRFVIVPHTNPDGAHRNRVWTEAWPDVAAYLTHVDREPPGRDLEFGFPEMRPENRLVAAFMRAHAPLALHVSLHGMAFSEGAMLLIERHWAFRTEALREGFAAAAAAAGLRLHDHNRKGEKGFFYIEPGFTTTPEGEAMRTFFQAQGDDAMAARFHDSSMEYARRLGGDPLCLVTELPLFVLAPPAEAPPGVPAAYLAFKAQQPVLQQRLRRGEAIPDVLRAFGVTPLPVPAAVRLQLRTLDLALAAVG